MPVSFAIGLFWISVACCLVAQVLIVRSVLGARHLPSPSAELPRSPAWVELLWALVPAAVLTALLVVTLHAIQARETTRAAAAVVSP